MIKSCNKPTEIPHGTRGVYAICVDDKTKFGMSGDIRNRSYGLLRPNIKIFSFCENRHVSIFYIETNHELKSEKILLNEARIAAGNAIIGNEVFSCDHIKAFEIIGRSSTNINALNNNEPMPLVNSRIKLRKPPALIEGKMLAYVIFENWVNLAKILGISPQAPRTWAKNSVPEKHRATLVIEAKKRGFVIEEFDFRGDL